MLALVSLGFDPCSEFVRPVIDEDQRRFLAGIPVRADMSRGIEKRMMVPIDLVQRLAASPSWPPLPFVEFVPQRLNPLPFVEWQFGFHDRVVS